LINANYDKQNDEEWNGVINSLKRFITTNVISNDDMEVKFSEMKESLEKTIKKEQIEMTGKMEKMES